MQTITKVALDAMGGDNAPAEIVKGAVDAVSSREDIKVFSGWTGGRGKGRIAKVPISAGAY